MIDSEQVLAVFVSGARGRAGDALIRAIAQSENITLVGACDRSDIPGIGQDAGSLAHTTHLDVRVLDSFEPRRGSVVVDLALPELLQAHLEICQSRALPLVLGPAARDPQIEATLTQAAGSIPIVHSANYSVGLTLLSHLAQQAASVLGESWDLEIMELHHASKRKSPSRSAQRLGEDLLAARQTSNSCIVSRGPGSAPRQKAQVGIASMRGGGSVGEHSVYLLHDDERIELSHRAFDRSVFARGVLRAARWVKDQPPGLYDMRDVLGLEAIS